MSKHRLAIVGLGKSVGNHLRTFEALTDRVDLVAAVDVDPERVNDLCADNPGVNGYTSVDEMLQKEQPELVCVVTPPASHRSISIACLEAGAWVYCEKPLCASLADFEAIQAAEERTDGYVSTVFQWRFGSAVKHLKRLMADESLGKPLVAVCQTLWYRTQDYYDVPWRGHYETEFGGPTMTLGIHLMDLLLYLMGDWESVQATISTLDRDIEVESISMAMIRFQNNAMASVINSVLSPRQESYLRLDFQKATVEMTGLYRASNENWRFSTVADDAATQALWDALNVDFQGSHAQQLSEILDCKERGERPPVSGDTARPIIEFIASLYKSAQTGQVVRRGDINPDDPFYYSNNGSRKVAERL